MHLLQQVDRCCLECVRTAVYAVSFLCHLRSLSAVQFSPLTDLVLWEHKGRFSRDPVPVFSAGGPCEQFQHGQGCSLFDVIHPAFPLPTKASLTLQGALKDGLERLSLHVTCLDQENFHLLTVARRGSCGPTRKLILLHTQMLVLRFFSDSTSRVHVSQP